MLEGLLITADLSSWRRVIGLIDPGSTEEPTRPADRVGNSFVTSPVDGTLPAVALVRVSGAHHTQWASEAIVTRASDAHILS